MAGRPVMSEGRRHGFPSRRTLCVLLILLGLAISGVVAGTWSSSIRNLLSPIPDRGSVTDLGLTSWNPHVSCSADLVTIRDVLGPAYPSQTVNGSRYQTNSTAGGIPQERALSPPCTITNRTGQVLSSFVQINGVSLYGYGVKTTDCSGWYSKQNGGGRYPGNQTFCTNAGQIITIGTKSGYRKLEIDRDWLGKGYCGVGVSYCDNATLGQYQSNGSISLDVQGFVFWEGPWHWEVHPLTGWRLSAPPTAPSAPRNLAATGGNAQVTLNWQAPSSDGGSPITNYKIYRGLVPGGESLLTTVGNVLSYTDTSVTNGLTYYYQVTATNGAGESPKSNEVSATPTAPPPPPPDFGISAAPSSLTIHLGSSGTSTITLSSLNGFAGTVSLSSSIACSGTCIIYPTATLNPASVTLAAGGAGTSMLTVSTTVLTTPGTYVVLITATSGFITHTVTVAVQVTIRSPVLITAACPL